MTSYETLKQNLRSHPRKWLVTGVGGFIGSGLLQTLLELDQQVVGLDNFSTGHKKNLQQVEALVGQERWKKFQFIEGDIRKLADCKCACHEVDFVLHQAALGSVPRSIVDPISSHESNVTGFLNMLVATRDAKAKRFVYASSSAIFGDHPELPKVEENVGNVLSPYAATKKMNEIYAAVFARAYNFESVGLRYFNVFGPRQDPEGAYAAVIPKWIAAILKREPVLINGDGETSRDFCFVENVVQANLLAATTTISEAINQTYNIAVGERTTLNELFSLLQSGLRKRNVSLPDQKPVYQHFRAGDVRHSLADIGKAKQLLGYDPVYRVREGLEMAMDWYKQNVV
ncbi:MAG: SDR family oxidoreductase [Verrucomicrobiota bacterium]